MSLPKHTPSPSLSSSPSRQSIRRHADSNAPSRPQSIIDRPPTAQQTHHPLESTTTHDPLLDNPPSQAHQGDGHHEFPSNPSQHHHQPPPFQPFFTLIEDANTSEYYHPTVHYIFSDDDTDIVTEAALRSLENDQDVLSQGAKGKSKPVRTRDGAGGTAGEEVYEEEDDEFAIARKDPLLPPPIPGVRDNYIILDLETALSDETAHPVNRENTAGASSSLPSQTQTHPHSAGVQPQQQQQQHPNTPNPQSQPHPLDYKAPQPPQFTVSSAHSLTPSWQVLNTQIIPAPTFEKNTSNEPVNGGLMLKIQGTAGLPITLLGKDRDKERSSQRLEEMMDQFSKRLGELRQVIEAGEQGQFCGEEERGGEGVEERDVNDAMPAEGFGTDNALGVNLEGEGGAELGNDEIGMKNEG